MEEKDTVKQEQKNTMKKLCEQVDKKLDELTNAGIQQGNVEYIYKLVDIKKDIKEMEEPKMYRDYGNYGTNYSNYGGGRMRDSQGRFMEGRNYGRRYRGHDVIDDMGAYYGNYMENRENGRYGSPEANKYLDYMLQSVEEFMQMLSQEAGTPEEMEKIKRTARKISDM